MKISRKNNYEVNIGNSCWSEVRDDPRILVEKEIVKNTKINLRLKVGAQLNEEENPINFLIENLLDIVHNAVYSKFTKTQLSEAWKLL